MKISQQDIVFGKEGERTGKGCEITENEKRENGRGGRRGRRKRVRRKRRRKGTRKRGR